MSKYYFQMRYMQLTMMAALMGCTFAALAQTQPDDAWLAELTQIYGKDEVQTHKKLLTKAKAGDLPAQHALGELLIQSDRTDEGVAWLKYAANQGYAPAIMTLSDFYLGELTQFDRDLEQAIYWLEKATQHAEVGSEAAFALAELYSKEQKIYRSPTQVYTQPANLEKARYWYEQSALLGNKNAQLELGVIYLKAKGVPKDSVQGFKWILMAAENGNSTAAQIIGLMYDTGEGVTQSNERALYWYAKPAQGYVDAMVDFVAKNR